jgi:hypothetical protein
LTSSITNFPSFYPWEGDAISGAQKRVRLGHYDRANLQPHIANNEAPGDRRNIFRIGNQDLGIPDLSPEQRRRIMLLKSGHGETATRDNLDARIAVIQAILAPLYPAVTYDFLRQHLTIPLTDDIFAIALRE